MIFLIWPTSQIWRHFLFISWKQSIYNKIWCQNCKVYLGDRSIQKNYSWKSSVHYKGAAPFVKKLEIVCKHSKILFLFHSFQVRMGHRLLQAENYCRKNSCSLTRTWPWARYNLFWRDVQNSKHMFGKFPLFTYNLRVPATEELDSTNVIEDALVIMISPTMVPSHSKMSGRKLHFTSLNLC